jgi:hypothetical protein
MGRRIIYYKSQVKNVKYRIRPFVFFLVKFLLIEMEASM